MPVEFLTDDEAASYGAYMGPPSQAELEKVFFLDDEDRALVEKRRGSHMKLGFALQLVTVRYLGLFLEDPVDVPTVVVDFVAGQLGIDDPSCVKRYTEREKTRFDHAWEIQRACGLKEFTEAEAELREWVAARAKASGDGPKAIFNDAVRWLRERDVLLPGLTTLARLVASVREEATQQLWRKLEALLSVGQRGVLDALVEVPPGASVSDLERWRKGAPRRASGPSMIKALNQVSEIMGLGLAELGIEEVVPPRRLSELHRYGMTAKATALRRHPDARRLATLMATVRHLEARSVDDTLELLDLLMTTELLNKANTPADKEKVRKHPRLTKATARLAVAVEALLDAEDWGSEEEVRVAEVWEAIEAVVSRADLRAAVATVTEMVPPPGAETEADDWRAELVGRFSTVSGFVKLLTPVIEFGANAEGQAVLAAMRRLPDVLAYRTHKPPAALVPGDLIDPGVVPGPWKRLVFGHPAREDGTVDRNAYTFCVLEQFWRHLKRREIFADASTRWRNPQAQLLDADAWQAVKSDVLTTLGLPEDPDGLLAGHARVLDEAYRQVAGRLVVNDAVRIDEDGKIHLTGVKAIEEPPSLVDLRKRTAAMLPRVDLPEVILEVMSWEPGIAAAFTAASGGRSRLEDLDVSIAACMAAHAMNVGYRPIAKKGVPALEWARLSHVFQNYFRPETVGPANAPMVTRQTGIALARAWGGGMVAAVDGMRFVVPVPALFARPNRKFFGPKRGMTWLNAINDQGMGRGAKVVSGTVRDSLHMVDVIFGLDGGELPEIVVSDTGSYSDLVFGLLELLGISYRPALADLPDQKGWRINAEADYGALNTFARGKIDLARIRKHWPDILRVVASIYTGKVRAYDVVTMLQRDGHPTALGEALAAYGRIFKSLHILAFIDVDEAYRRDIKHIRNLQEGRHDLARRICHGKKGELFHHYERGLENQLGVLGLVLNCVVLWNTVYLNAAIEQLKAQGYPVRDEDAARLSPFVRKHLNVHGTYSFALPELAPGAIRELRDPDAPDDEEEG
jgi:TnpA family transposase